MKTLKKSNGTTVLEYAIIAGLITVVAIALIINVGSNVQKAFSDIASATATI